MKRILLLIFVSGVLTSCGLSGLTVPPSSSSGPTPTPTSIYGTIPMGHYVLGVITASVYDYGSGPTTTIGGVEVWVANNQQAVTNATVVVTTPSGPVTVPYFYTLPAYTYTEGIYETFPSFTYTPGYSYSLSVSDSFGTVSASMPAPGGITWSGSITSTLTGTAAYPGNYDSASVLETYPSPVTTYNSNTTNVGSPFNFPTSAFSASSPATFAVAYSASTTQYSFTGSPASGSAFIWNENYGKYFNK